MTELTHELGAGRPPVPEPHAGVACCTVADLPSGPVTCGPGAGHRGPRAWAALIGPTGSRVPAGAGRCARRPHALPRPDPRAGAGWASTICAQSRPGP